MRSSLYSKILPSQPQKAETETKEALCQENRVLFHLAVCVEGHLHDAVKSSFQLFKDDISLACTSPIPMVMAGLEQSV